MAIFELLAKLDAIFKGEGMEMFKKPEDMLKSIVLAS